MKEKNLSGDPHNLNSTAPPDSFDYNFYEISNVTDLTRVDKSKQFDFPTLQKYRASFGHAAEDIKEHEKELKMKEETKKKR